VYTVLASTLRADAAAGLTLTRARRIRDIIVMVAGLARLLVAPRHATAGERA
jgi:hypothetical protein